MSECPNCGQAANSAQYRLIKDTCGHTKCRMCLLYEEKGCKACENEFTIRSIGNFDYSTPSTNLLHSTNTDIGNTDCSKNSRLIPVKVFEEDINNAKVYKDEPKAINSYKFKKYKLRMPEEHHPNSLKDTQKDSGEELEVSNKKRFSDWSHIVTIPGNPETYKCNICNKVFRNRKGRIYHNGCVTGIRPFKCNICDKSFIKRSHYEYHERMHTGYKPYKCHICNKAFPQKGKLNRHMFSHNEEKELACQQCGKKFGNQEYLKTHLNVHSETAPYVCKFCPKSFRLMSNLTRHIRSHSNERPYKCDQCGKTFKEKSLLARHKRTHEKDRPFGCDNCTRVFLSKSELKRHMMVHSEEKPFSCEFCHIEFRRKDNLNRHIRHHHMENSNTEDPEPPKVKSKQVEKAKKVSKPKQKQKSSAGQKILPKVNVGLSSQRPINSRSDAMGNVTSVIRTIGSVSNAVPVINGPISIKKFPESAERKKTFTHVEPIPVAEAVDINRRIEEKLYPQNATNRNYFCDYLPTERINDESVNRVPTIQTVFSMHWRRRTAESLKKR